MYVANPGWEVKSTGMGWVGVGLNWGEGLWLVDSKLLVRASIVGYRGLSRKLN